MSKLYFIPYFLYLYTCITECSKHTCDTTKEKGPVSAIDTGTVLFTAADVYKQCWSPDELAILTTRMILQDLLPEVNILSIDSNEFIDDIVDYFRLLIEVVKTTTHGRKKHITLLALTDLMGGYLQFAVLPIARHAFYSGYIDFTSMIRLIQLFEELKWFLRTNGQGWSKPIDSKPQFQVNPIDFQNETPKTGRSCCDRLIFYEIEKHQKGNCTDGKSDVFFPLPFFDSKVRPNSIAVPFRRFALRNIESRKASYLLLKFFISAIQCMKDKKSDKEAVAQFQNNIFGWIEKEVIPKLRDDKFYSAFGGVLRVVETLKALGAKAAGPSTCEGPDGEDEIRAARSEGPKKSSKSSIIIAVMLVTIVVWFIIGTAFICYRIRKNHPKNKRNKAEDEDYDTTTSSKWSMFSKRRNLRNLTIQRILPTVRQNRHHTVAPSPA
ncbi:hypothetical protein JTB14_022179 [Gonioctena quinquepunctata]|nr:hypothetical protein JTB14_022179 [Gonioctena quinquepunctata]